MAGARSPSFNTSARAVRGFKTTTAAITMTAATPAVSNTLISPPPVRLNVIQPVSIAGIASAQCRIERLTNFGRDRPRASGADLAIIEFRYRGDFGRSAGHEAFVG